MQTRQLTHSQTPGLGNALKRIAASVFLLAVTGCVECGTLVYDLSQNRAAGFIPEGYRHESLLVQRGANGDTFIMMDIRDSYTKNPTVFFSERDIKGRVVSKWKAMVPPNDYPLADVALSPNLERVAFPEKSTVLVPPPRPPFVRYVPEYYNEIRITAKDGTPIKTLVEKVTGFGSSQGIYWLSDDVVMTYSSDPDNREHDRIIKYDFKTDEEKTFHFPFGSCSMYYDILPSPDNRHVLLLRDPGEYVGVLDAEAMELLCEVRITQNRRGPVGFAWANNDAFLAWDQETSKVIRYDLTARQRTPVEVGFPVQKYQIRMFAGKHFILSHTGNWSTWSYNIETGYMRKIANRANGSVYPLTDSIILFDRTSQ